MNLEKHISIPGRLDKLSEIRTEISGFISGLFDEITVSRIVLSVDEAVSNVIRHGYGNSDGTVRLELRRDPGLLRIIITDDAPFFNPLATAADEPEITAGRNATGGLGVDFYRRMMNATYERTHSGENRLILSKEIPHENE